MAVTVGCTRRPQEAPGGPRMLQEPRRLQEASGGIRRPQEAPGGPRRPQEAPAGSRTFQEAPGGFRRQEAPGMLQGGDKNGPERAKSVIGVAKIIKHWPERAKSVIGVAKMDPREPNL